MKALHGRLVTVVALMASATLGAGVTAVTVAKVGTGLRSPESRVCAIDPADGEVAITAAIAGCPNESTVRFPLNRTYHQGNRIMVADRTGLTIDGNGSTFLTTADRHRHGPELDRHVNGNWLILRGSDITLKNMTARGVFDVPAPRNLERAATHPDAVEYNPSFGLYGVDGAQLVDVKSFNSWGDGVTLGADWYIDHSVKPENARYNRNIRIDRMEVQKAFRMCWGPTSGTGIWIRDSICRDAWYAGIDAEHDTPDQPLRDVHFLRNTFDGYFHYGILVSAAGDPGTVADFEIRGNKLLTGADNRCQPGIVVGAWANDPRRFSNIVTADNEVWAMATAIAYDHVDGGVINGNLIHKLPAPPGFETPESYCGHFDVVRVTNSSRVER